MESATRMIIRREEIGEFGADILGQINRFAKRNDSRERDIIYRKFSLITRISVPIDRVETATTQWRTVSSINLGHRRSCDQESMEDRLLGGHIDGNRYSCFNIVFLQYQD